MIKEHIKQNERLFLIIKIIIKMKILPCVQISLFDSVYDFKQIYWTKGLWFSTLNEINKYIIFHVTMFILSTIKWILLENVNTK